MKTSTNKKLKNSNCRLLLWGIFIILNITAHCQTTGQTIQFSMEYQYSEKEIDSLKWDIVTNGNESSWFECELALFYKYKGSASAMYKEFFPCTLIMAYVYDCIPAYYFIYTILKDYSKERGYELKKEELQLCIRSLNIISSKIDRTFDDELDNLKMMMDRNCQ